VRQWNNVLFDLLVLHAADALGFVAAERIAVSLAVLIFFWGSFSFMGSVSGRPPWVVTPFLMVLAYGYAFHMGFMNYYLSVGLAFFALAAAWGKGAGNWLCALALAALALLAHPIGFLVFVAVALYALVWRNTSGLSRIALLFLAVLVLVYLRWLLTVNVQFDAEWGTRSWLDFLGQDQLKLFGRRYSILAWVVLVWALLGAARAIYHAISHGQKPSAAERISLEFYALSVLATLCLPENLRFAGYGAWAGLLVSRLTLVTAVFGLLILASLRLPRWYFGGMLACVATFFVFVFQDTRTLDRMESNARALVQELPFGTRVVAVASAPAGWRIPFVHHSIERACVGRCFSYANYEPSSLQFRLRALPGSFVVQSNFKAEAIAKGDYVVQRSDLPLTSIYQCDPVDFTHLCVATLEAGQKTGNPK
jgi:hypothetical protein